MKYRMTLDYDIPTGDLTPYFDALATGRALASKCNSCGHVAFPARTTCQRCAGQINWAELPGTAKVLVRTDGPTGSFALVRFDGSDTNSTVALKNPEAYEPEARDLQAQKVLDAQDALATQQPQSSPDVKPSRGSLIVPPTEQPGLWLALTTNNEENDDER